MSVKLTIAATIFYLASISSAAAESYIPEFIIPEKSFSDLRYNVVLNGENASSEDFDEKNFLVHLVITDKITKKKNKCTGFIVASDLVMTAGHCLKNNDKTIQVKFGYGGAYGFDDKIVSGTYRSFYPIKKKSSTPNWTFGHLNYDSDKAEDFRKRVESRSDFYQKSSRFNSFNDIALIKIDRLPAGYTPIKLYSGTVGFKQKVYVAGFGTNDHWKFRQTDELKIAALSLVGTAVRNNLMVGVQSFDLTEVDASFCFGDSGGPMLIRDKNDELKVLAINIFVHNRCRSGGWSVVPGMHSEKIMQWIEEMRKSQWT